MVQANVLLSEENVAALSGAIDDVKTITGALALQAPSLERVVDDIDRPGRQPGWACRGDADRRGADQRPAERPDRQARPHDRLRDGRAGGDRPGPAAKLADSYTELGNEVSGLIADIRPELEQFAGSGLTEFTLMVTELRGLAETLSRVAEQIERAPARFLFGETGRGVPTE